MNSKNEIDCIFQSPELASVITLQEACILWNKTPRQLHWAINRDQVVSRKSITSGTWLVTYSSLLSHFGEPAHNINEWMV